MKKKVYLGLGSVLVTYAVVTIVLCLTLGMDDPSLVGATLGIMGQGLFLGFIGISFLCKARRLFVEDGREEL